MKRLVIFVLVLAMGWAAYWYVMSSAVQGAFETWFEDRRNEGWLAEYQDLSVSGFPNRVDTTFTGLALADPDTGIALDLPFFQLFALSYKPNHVIAVWPNDQRLSYPGEKISIVTEDMRASLVLSGAPSLPLERSNLVVKGLQAVSSADWRLGATELRVALHRVPETDAAYGFAVDASNLAPPASYRVNDTIDLPRALKTVHGAAEITFDAPLDRSAIEVARPQPVLIDLKQAEMIWGDLELQATGKVDVDAAGYPTGTLTIRATNWRDIIGVARASEELPDSLLDGTEAALEMLAGLSGNPKTLDIPLSFENRRTWLGPLPVGPAPILRLR